MLAKDGLAKYLVLYSVRYIFTFHYNGFVLYVPILRYVFQYFMNRNWFVIFVVAQVINILLFSWINCILKFGFRLDFLESVSEILWTCERWQRYLSVYEISWLTVTHTFSFFPTLIVWWRLFSIQFFRYFSFFLKNNMTDFSLVSALFRVDLFVFLVLRNYVSCYWCMVA